ncbi:MAG: lysylphosphatidylglycerol synthase transmembrane domain-containing protein [Candidatus Scalindua sp.]
MRYNQKYNIFIAGILISIVCSWLFARKVEWSNLNEAFSEVNYLYIIHAIVILAVIFYLRIIRWSVILLPVQKVSLLNLFSSTAIGFMANNILPARAGELIKPIVLGKKENIKITTCIATVAMERIFDLLSIIILATTTFAILPYNIPDYDDTAIQPKANAFEANTSGLSDNTNTKKKSTDIKNETNLTVIKQLRKWSTIFAVIGIFVIAFLFALIIYPKKASVFVNKIIFFMPHYLKDRFIRVLNAFISGLQILENKRKLLWIGCISLSIWFLNILLVYVLSYSFNIDLPFLGASFVCVCVSLSLALPQAPGYIGVFHIATQKSLDIFGADLTSAQSYAIVLWAISIIPVTLVGLFFLWKERISLGEIIKQEKAIS